MNKQELYAAWKAEEDRAHIHGWDFSHIEDRYEQEPLPWDYETVLRQYLREDARILDYDTGGGEFLRKLGHPYANTAATEGYPPNVELCKEELLPLGIDFRPCSDPSHIPFEDESFDIILNRHGAFDPREIHRLLKPGGLFITQQVGGNNDRELVEMVLPDLQPAFCDLYLDKQQQAFARAGFRILEGREAYQPIRFFDMGAFVWFARIIQWEFTGFSVDACFDRLLKMQQVMEAQGKVEGTYHRYLLVAQK